MFTGIVRACGAVKSRRAHGRGCRLTLDLGALASAPIGRGDSVAVGGACLTVTEFSDGVAAFDVSPETLDCCRIGEWQAGDAVNLEPALTLQTPLGGHLLTGHIDGIGTVQSRAGDGGFTRLGIETTADIGRLIAAKGCIAVDGVSLTVNTVADRAGRTQFEVMVVPHTLAKTTLGALQPGARVHIEVDIMARYAARLLGGGRQNSADNSGDRENTVADTVAAGAKK